MWIPTLVAEYLKISKDAVDELRIELAAVRAERDALRYQQATDRTNADWLRVRVNALEQENKALIERAYQIKLPAPELVRTPAFTTGQWSPATRGFDPQMLHSGFDDIGEDVARALGLESYESPEKK